MKRGDSSSTTSAPDDGAQLIFPLAAEPSPHRGRLGKALAGGLIAAIMAGAVVATVNQLDGGPAAGKWAVAESSKVKPVHRVDDTALSVFQLRPGTCLRDLADGTDVQDVAVVPCDQAHAAEVVATLRMPDTPWPGAAAVEEYATDWCVPALLGAGFDTEPEAKWTYFGPTESSWNVRDDRMISCLVVTSNAQLNQIEQPSPPPGRVRRELEGMVGQ